MTATLLSLNVGMPKIIGKWHGAAVLSGFDKQPVISKTVIVTATGIHGDGQADLENHGGVDKAVYAYPARNWPWWEKEKQLLCRAGLFGENLTLGDLDEANVYIGDRFAWGDVIVEVCQPRAPCFKLAIYTGRADLPLAMTLSGRCGWYFRVVKEGTAPTTGALTRIVRADAPSVQEAFSAVFAKTADRALLQRIKQTPALSEAWQHQVDRRLGAVNR
ncbi:MAG: MOSC domain-containing protein [Rhizomicrobium sp.]|nr:MOSC domain-containing protein [Rhizomicrobium sp.]